MQNLTLAALAHGQFWAILPSYATAAYEELKRTDYDAHVAQYEASLATRAENPVNPEDRRYPLRDGVAIIRIDGVMTKRPMSYSRGTSTLLTRRAVEQAAIDTEVRSILIVADSPGGSVDGVQDLHDAIRAVNKPCRGHIDGGAYSAAYWALCACDRITIGRSDSCGSLGVMAVLADTSEMAKAEGVEVILFATGELKGQGTSGVPISEKARAMYQGHVDALGEFFAASIRQGRGLTEKQTRAIFTGGIFSAQEALRLGLVDAIDTLDGAVAALSASEEDDLNDLEEAPEAADRIRLTTEQRASLSAGVPLERFAELTNSAPVGGATSPDAGTQRGPTAGPTGTPMNQKSLLVRALQRVGLGIMATKIANSPDEDMDGMAATMAAQVDDEVKNRVAHHPLIVACDANGIKDPADLAGLVALKEIGAKHFADTRAEAKAEAVRAYGAELGPQMSAQVEHLPYQAVVTLRDSFRATADAKFGTGDNKPGARHTVPGGALTAVDVDDATPKTAWDRLSDEQKAMARKGGYDTDDKREAFAKNLLQEAN
jgi:signal peptide peptidase SppA